MSEEWEEDELDPVGGEDVDEELQDAGGEGLELEAEEQERTTVSQRYQDVSRVVDDGDGERLALFTDLDREDLSIKGGLREPLRIREALSTLYEIVKSDFRYKPKDRTAYLAYVRSRQQTSSSNLLEAQKAYFDWLARNDPTAFFILDPIITAQPDGLLMEVFSKDEGSYASMHIGWEAFDLDEDPSYGTTNIDFSQTLYDGFQRMRSYRDTRLEVGADEVSVQTSDDKESDDEIVEKRIQVPNTWLRGFLQVQSAATLMNDHVSIAPIDLYNVLRQLRLNADQKRGGRAIRMELIPGQAPRLVLEPWEMVIETQGEPYRGRTAHVTKIWGRRRLLMLRRILPSVESIDVHLMGSGLPSFWVLRCGELTFTLGLTGFTAANWSQAVTFDTLLPRPTHTSEALDRALDYLSKAYSASVEVVAEELGLSTKEALRALQSGCQQGKLMFDIAAGVYRLRPLLAEELNLEKLQYRNDRERVAHDLLAGKGGSVTIDTENRIHGFGIEYDGTVVVEADRREYRVKLVIDDSGRVRKAEDTSPWFRQKGLKEGPSAPILAMRLAIAKLEADRAAQRGTETITVETRTYVRRDDQGERLYQVTLDRQRLRLRWGERSQERLRSQNLVFNSVEEARDAYFHRIADIERQGYMDAGA